MNRVLSLVAAVSCLATIMNLGPIALCSAEAEGPHSATVDWPEVIILPLPIEATGVLTDQNNLVWTVDVTADIRDGPTASADLVGVAYAGAEVIQVATKDAEWVQIADPETLRTGWMRSDVLSAAREKVAAH